MTTSYRFKHTTTPGSYQLKAAASQAPAVTDVRLDIQYGTAGQTGTLDISADNLTASEIYNIVQPLVL